MPATTVTRVVRCDFLQPDLGKALTFYQLLTGYGELLLAEFKYGLVPKETFSSVVDQAKSRRAFYWLKKELFPYAYWKYMVSYRQAKFKKPAQSQFRLMASGSVHRVSPARPIHNHICRYILHVLLIRSPYHCIAISSMITACGSVAVLEIPLAAETAFEILVRIWYRLITPIHLFSYGC